jgi:glycosyltransferase involved in cell wall biosynthesis
MPTVSICLPVFNGEPFLAEAIESALAQTFEDFELLISDDGSEDSSVAIAEGYAKRDDRIVLWSNRRNLGLFANYNECLARATGKLIKPFAQDDLLEPNMLARLLQTFEASTNIVLASTQRLGIDQDGTPLALDQFQSTRLIAGDELIKGCLPSFTNWIGEPSAVMFPASVMNTGFDTSFFHLGDLEYWFRLAKHGNYAFLMEPLCQVRRHKESATNNNLIGLTFVVDALRLGRLYSSYLAESGVSEIEYTQRTIESGAAFVHHQVKRFGLSCQDTLDARVRDSDKNQLLNQFRELSFHALYYLHESLINQEAIKAEAAAERRALEDHLHDSKIWRTAQTLKWLAQPCVLHNSHISNCLET